MSKTNLRKWFFQIPWLKNKKKSRESERTTTKKKRFGPIVCIHHTPVERKVDRPSRTKLEAGILFTLLILITLVLGGIINFVSWNYRDIADGYQIWEIRMEMKDQAISKQDEYIKMLKEDKSNLRGDIEDEKSDSTDWKILYKNAKADNEGLIIGYGEFLKVLNRETGKIWEIIPRPGKSPLIVEKKVIGKDRKP